MTRLWARRARLPAGWTDDVLVEADAAGAITRVTAGAPAPPDAVALGTVVPGLANAHSHAFHRALRGRTHTGGGDFWVWREAMYAAAAELAPDSYRALATAVYRELAAAGYTVVGEFHYVHHALDGSPYLRHDMELALVDAAEEVGLRLVLLDACYLAGGVGRPLAREQARFGDGTAERWLERWHALRDALGTRPLVTLGAAVHSVRAVPPEALATIAVGLPAGVPLHAHVSEQPAENEAVQAAYGATPTRLLAEAGLVSPGFSAVHATHLAEDDVRLLGNAAASVVACPTTEADLGDGIGPLRALADAGAVLAIGSDQHAVADPLLELRALEYAERLASRERGRFSPAELWAASTTGGYRALGLDGGVIAEGTPCDLVELDAASTRTAGADPEQLPLVATAADVTTVVVAGRVLDTGDPAGRYRELLGGEP